MNYFPQEGHVYLPNNSYIHIYILMVPGEGKRARGVYPTSCVEYHLIVASNEICLKLNFQLAYSYTYSRVLVFIFPPTIVCLFWVVLIYQFFLS